MFTQLLIALAQAVTSAPASPSDIIVIGRRAEQALALCLSRNCSPAEEVEASLQASVEQFADGRYRDARTTLQSAIRRNRDHAGELPGPVSSLYATLATVAEHEGDTGLWLSSARNNVLVLRRYLGEAHSATLKQEFAFADSMVGLGRPNDADAIYRKVQQVAAQHGLNKLESGAVFRRAWVALISGRDKEALRLADESVVIAGENDRLMVELRDIVRMQIAVRRGNEDAVDALATRLRQSATQAPRLLFAPAVEDINPVRSSLQRQPKHDSGVRFADVGYWVRPDGRTAEAEVLRTSGLGQWEPGILRQVQARRYIPLEVEPGHPGVYRIDRFTVRGNMGVPTGSRIRQRMGNLSVHVVDLTETDEMSAARHQRAEEAKAKDGA
ncbi:tetratricopeptide repeat protein [Novosphingobium lindaniclasticum]|uniref:Uncharacterized protein n=1 Tax=Novosphingobium lindaniclasticum LE124 TaxID=1096930 RepID=T0HTP0_9SPHN|nr:hypothetical protein [Novosphingobium lindaniclasticum]EQB19731.1 hypothetical protein L284_00150 [Novosphingobium lindaniclasticum LE124]